MIEIALKKALEEISGLPVYPIKRPNDVADAITYQCVSDSGVEIGLVRTGLINARYQITIWSTVSYQRVRQIDTAIWHAWRDIRHGTIDDYPVQYVERLTRFNDLFIDDNGDKTYMLARDWRIWYPEIDYAPSYKNKGVG